MVKIIIFWITLLATPAVAMTATREGGTIVLRGMIKIGDNNLFDRQVAKAQDDGHAITRVVITIPGGDVWSAVRMADAILDTNATVSVIKRCSSACSIIALTALAAGRLELAPGALVGVHAPRATDDDGHSLGTKCSICDTSLDAYLTTRGVPATLRRMLFATPTRDMKWYSAGDLARYSATALRGQP